MPFKRKRASIQGFKRRVKPTTDTSTKRNPSAKPRIRRTARDIFAEDVYVQGLESARREDLTGAASFYKQAAAAQHTRAMYELGCCYDNGDGVEQNSTTAVE